METLNHIREQQPYSWPFMNAIDTGRGGGHLFHQPMYLEAKENPGEVGIRVGSEERTAAMQAQRLHLIVLKIHLSSGRMESYKPSGMKYAQI